MLTAYLDHLQHASAGAQIVGCVLGFFAIGLGPFTAHIVIDHVRVNLRIARQTRTSATLQFAPGGR